MPISIESDPTLPQGYIKVNGTTAATISTAGIVSGGIPAGAVMPFAMSSAPSGWLAADGSPVSRTTYAALFAAIGTTHGSGDGSTTFNLPDLRGEFVRGWDNGRGVDAGRVFGAAQSASRVLNRVGTAAGGYGSGSFSGFRYHADSNGLQAPDDAVDTTTDQLTTADGAGGSSQNTRNFYRAIRPRNIALLYCIKH